MAASEKRSDKNAIVSPNSLDSRWRNRMTPAEAIAGTKRMLSNYPETNAEFSEEYLLTIAQTLCQFPLEVATAACSPVHGVPRESQFKPTAVHVHEWCERETQLLWKRLHPLKAFAQHMPPAAQTETGRLLMVRKWNALIAYFNGDAPWNRELLPGPPEHLPDGHYANLFVPNTATRYAEMVERASDPDTYRQDWKWYSGHPQWGAGIKVPYSWWVNPGRGGSWFKRMTQAQAQEFLDKAKYGAQAQAPVSESGQKAAE